MKTFIVTWVIEIDAESHKAAAQRAQEIQRDPDSIATVFHVKQQGKDALHEIDLQGVEP